MKKSKIEKSYTLPKPMINRTLTPRSPLVPSLSIERRDYSAYKSNRRTSRISTRPAVSSRLLFHAQLMSPVSHDKIEGIPVQQICVLYELRCEDLKIPVIPDQKNRFLQTCLSQLANRNFCLPEQGLGPRSAEFISKILCNSTQFAYLNLAGNAISDKGALQITDLLQSSSNIVHLNISANEISSEGTRVFLDRIASQSSLVSLDLSSADNKNRISGPGLVSLESYLASNKLLTHLNLAGSLLCKDGIAALAKGLKRNTTLLYLNVSNNSIGDQSCFWKAVFLSSVQDLNVSNNKISESSFIEIPLGSSKSLNKLDLSKNSLEDITELFRALRSNTSLKQLNLASNKIKSTNTSAIVSSLKENSTLDTLNLAYCELPLSFLTCLGLGLGCNTSVQSLNLSNNEINDKSISSFAEGLINNKTLKVLNLNANRITNKGCMALASSLQENCSFSKLFLNSNNIKNLGAEALFKLTKMNNNLLMVNIDNNQGDLKFGRLISKTCSSHQKTQMKEQVPVIRDRLDTLRGTVKDIESVEEDMQKARKQKRLHTVRLQRQMRRLKEMKSVENCKLQHLNQDFLKLRIYSQQLSKQIIEIKNKSVQVEARFTAKEREMNSKINRIEKELRESEVKISKLKELQQLHRRNQQILIENTMEELAKTNNSLHVAQIKLSFERTKADKLKKSKKRCSKQG